MKKPKYHFLTIIRRANGKFIMALPGQTFGLHPVPSGVMVKDKKSPGPVARARTKGEEGDVFFTTTLKKSTHNLVAEDIYPLNGQDDIMFSDVHEAYEKFIKENK